MSTTARSPQHGDGSRTSARSKISAVHFIRWRDGAGRRAGFLAAVLFAELAVAAAFGGPRAPENRERIESASERGGG